ALRTTVCAPTGDYEAPFGEAAFELENGLPTWCSTAAGVELRQTIFMPHAQNTVRVLYRVRARYPVRLRVRPFMKVRPVHAAVDVAAPPLSLTIHGTLYEFAASGGPAPLRVAIEPESAVFVAQPRTEEWHFELEARRGYPASGSFSSPGEFVAELSADGTFAFTASVEPWDSVRAHTAADALSVERARRGDLLARAVPAAQNGLAAELVLAADAFVISPAAQRANEQSRALARGDDVRSVVAGYHWFTDWGRD